MDQFASNISVFRRWAAASDQPPPESFKSFREKLVSEAFKIQQQDPELCTLLSGEAPAGLLATSFLASGRKSRPPCRNAKSRQQAELQSLYDSKPWGGRDGEGKDIAPNVTNACCPVPEIADRSKSEASIGHASLEAHEMRRAQDAAEQQRLRNESMMHGMSLAASEYPRFSLRQQIKRLSNEQG